DGVLVEEVDPSTGRNRYGGTAETRRRQVDWRLGRPPAATATTGNERERDEDHCNPHGFSLAQAPPPADVQMVTTPILFPVSLFFFAAVLVQLVRPGGTSQRATEDAVEPECDSRPSDHQRGEDEQVDQPVLAEQIAALKHGAAREVVLRDHDEREHCGNRREESQDE